GWDEQDVPDIPGGRQASAARGARAHTSRKASYDKLRAVQKWERPRPAGSWHIKELSQRMKKAANKSSDKTFPGNADRLIGNAVEMVA
ncbi:MAG: hypothetical protein PHG65_09725, partial [Kiritimatiellae bacterium]|nr:hypothetical protein [Kiritimatiellia bacterium]